MVWYSIMLFWCQFLVVDESVFSDASLVHCSGLYRLRRSKKSAFLRRFFFWQNNFHENIIFNYLHKILKIEKAIVCITNIDLLLIQYNELLSSFAFYLVWGGRWTLPKTPCNRKRSRLCTIGTVTERLESPNQHTPSHQNTPHTKYPPHTNEPQKKDEERIPTTIASRSIATTSWLFENNKHHKCRQR